MRMRARREAVERAAGMAAATREEELARATAEAVASAMTDAAKHESDAVATAVAAARMAAIEEAAVSQKLAVEAAVSGSSLVRRGSSHSCARGGICPQRRFSRGGCCCGQSGVSQRPNDRGECGR